jgi:WD40 repeat protein
MRDDVLVTGGSDGSVRVWSLATYQAIHRLAAHDNSVTSLQFDNTRIVSGGSDGRVKVWDLKKGTLVRELSTPAEAVWRVVFEEEKAVIMASRGGRTIMEVSRPVPSTIWAHITDSHRYGTSLHPQTRTTTPHVLAAQLACLTISTSNTHAHNQPFYLAQHRSFKRSTMPPTSPWQMLD